ncbi:peptidyl-tRNA hydrolase [Pseudomonas syringae pv. actinidiae]|nr:peptidyl-tRNA hydrolase [Pseudomonas syringae pv. actinidiae]
MSIPLKIFVRQELNMRKGKMAPQSAHAAMKLFLEAMSKNDQGMKLSGRQFEEFSAFMENPVVEVVPVTGEDGMLALIDHSKPYAVITDSGRTEFAGVPTVTCGAQGIFSESPCQELEVPLYGKEIRAKQLFVFSKLHPLKKYDAAAMGALVCLKSIYERMVVSADNAFLPLAPGSPMSEWVFGAFAKIGLGVPSDVDLEVIKDSLMTHGHPVTELVMGENKVIAVGPAFPSDIDPLTGELRLI